MDNRRWRYTTWRIFGVPFWSYLKSVGSPGLLEEDEEVVPAHRVAELTEKLAALERELISLGRAIKTLAEDITKYEEARNAR